MWAHTLGHKRKVSGIVTVVNYNFFMPVLCVLQEINKRKNMSRIKELFLKTKYPSWIIEHGYCRTLRILDLCCEILFREEFSLNTTKYKCLKIRITRILLSTAPKAEW